MCPRSLCWSWWAAPLPQKSSPAHQRELRESTPQRQLSLLEKQCWARVFSGFCSEALSIGQVINEFVYNGDDCWYCFTPGYIKIDRKVNAHFFLPFMQLPQEWCWSRGCTIIARLPLKRQRKRKQQKKNLTFLQAYLSSPMWFSIFFYIVICYFLYFWQISLCNRVITSPSSILTAKALMFKTHPGKHFLASHHLAT